MIGGYRKIMTRGFPGRVDQSPPDRAYPEPGDAEAAGASHQAKPQERPNRTLIELFYLNPGSHTIVATNAIKIHKQIAE
jgi:hypothetical protein